MGSRPNERQHVVANTDLEKCPRRFLYSAKYPMFHRMWCRRNIGLKPSERQVYELYLDSLKPELRQQKDQEWKNTPKNNFFKRNLDRDEERKNDALLRKPEPSAEPGTRGPVALADFDHKTIANYVARLAKTDPEFDTILKTAFAEAARADLPAVAPKLWSDNTEGLPATAFVAKYYAPWIEAGVMTLKAIKACDPELGKAYSNRIHRHPDEAVALVRASRSDRIENPQEAIERVRKASRDASARRRAEQADKPANTLG